MLPPAAAGSPISIKDQVDAGVFDGDERRLDAEHLAYAFGREDFGGRAGRRDAPAVEHDYLVGEARGEVEVVDDADRHHVGRVREEPHLLHELYLVSYVQEGQGLVEEEVAAGRARSGSLGRR